MPTNLSELKQGCKEEWAATPLQQCRKRIKSFRKQLPQVITARVVHATVFHILLLGFGLVFLNE